MTSPHPAAGCPASLGSGWGLTSGIWGWGSCSRAGLPDSNGDGRVPGPEAGTQTRGRSGPGGGRQGACPSES